MSDRRRIVSIDRAGNVTLVRDLENSSSYFAVQDSFTVKAPPRNPIKATRNRRYGGWRTVAETHDNGEISWKMLVKGSTAGACITQLENALSSLESPRTDLFFEWQPDGAGVSVYYEIRGPAQYTPTYSWTQFQGVQSMYVDIAIPVGPLAWGDKYTISISSTVTPNVVQLASTIQGDAPALADITLRTSGGTSPPIWAMFGWSRRPGTPLSGYAAPFGVIEGESWASGSGFTSTADATARGGTLLSVTASGAGSALARWKVDPSVLSADDFRSEVDVEVWARVKMASTLVSPNVVVSLEPNTTTDFGAAGYTAEWGSLGKQLTLPSSGTQYRFIRLGTLTMPVDAVTPAGWRVVLSASWASGSSGTFAVDYLVMVPARAHALSPSGKANDSAYPDFIVTTADTSKTIRYDLSGLTASSTDNPGRDGGLGGSPIELPTGQVDMLIKLSSLVPDDPTIDSTSEQLSHTVTGTVTVTPRYWIARGS